MKAELKKLLLLSRQYTPILTGFFAILVIVALIVGLIVFFINRKSPNR